MHTTTDENSRARLLTMAQTWCAWADRRGDGESLESALREFNDQQMIPE